jgi:hypothetical protein|tara:strand:+ start:2225 stop:2455 length:231 start_codon:yes stop_codon:yes gene_type:complete
MGNGEPFLLTTIGGGGMVALLQTSDDPIKKRGRAVEYRVSTSFVKRNVEAGLFVDITDKVDNAEGRVYGLKADLPS